MNLIDDQAVQQSIIDQIARAVFCGECYNVKFATLDVPIELAESLRKFSSASSGFTSDTPWYDNVMRMLYLSVVTATTLGYGDIVPVTTWARGGIMIEALFGVILAGFFINSAFSEADEVPEACKAPDRTQTTIEP